MTENHHLYNNGGAIRAGQKNQRPSDGLAKW